MATNRDFVVKNGLVVTEDIELGHATDTTIARASAGDVNIEDNIIYRAGGTDVPVVDGGTGSSSASGARTNLGVGPTAGSTSIVTTGTIGTGTWEATDVAVAHGGTGVSTLTDGGVLLGSGTGAITAMAVLSDGEMIVGDGTTDPVAESGTTLRTSIGVGTGDTVQFTGINLGHASDTTIARASAGQITVEGTAVVLAGGANHDGFSDFVANEHIDHSGVTLTAGGGLSGGGTIAANRTFAVEVAQTTITSVLNTSLVVGRDSTDQIKFSTDNEIIFRVGNADGVTFKASGEIEATKFDGALEGNADTATSAGTVAVNPNDAVGSYVNENNLIMFLPDADGSSGVGYYRPESSTDFHYNPGTTVLTVPKIVGDVVGNVVGNISGNVTGNASGSAGTVTTIGNLTGDVTSSNRATTIANNAVSLAKMAGITRGSIIIGDASGDPAALAIGSNDYVLTSDGTDIAWEAAGGGGASAIDGLSDATTSASSVWLGSTPSNATDYNASLGIGALDAPNGTLGTKNVAVGYNAGTLNTEGYKNVFVGYAAGSANTNADENTFVGSQAGSVCTTGGVNTLIGADAGKSITTGGYNTLIGAKAGDGFDTESENVAIGYGALGGSVAGGDRNIAIGMLAMQSAVADDDNIAIGVTALSSLTHADDVIGIGHQAGYRVTTGNRQVLIGAQSGYELTTGSENVMVGYQTGTDCTGSSNTFIGTEAGYDVHEGGSNVFVGKQAGYGSSTSGSYNTGLGSSALNSLTTGANNISIGWFSGDALTEGNNNIFLGNQGGNNVTTGSSNVVIGNADVASATGNDQLSISSGDGSPVWITGDSAGFVTHTNGSDHTFVIVGEEGDLYAGTGSTGNANGYQFSYGNGRANVTNASSGADFGINVPHDCILERVDIVFGNSGNLTSGTTTFEVIKNGSAVSSSDLSTTASSGVHDTHHTGLSHTFASGDRFNLRTTTGSRQVGPIRMTARFRRTS